MTPEAFRLFRALAAGRPLNGMRYAEQAGISRSMVWKLVEQLRAAGLPVAAVRGSGYCLDWPIRMLNVDEIRRAEGGSDVTIEIVDRTDSTNRDLLDNFSHRHLRAAEFQAGGRGRRGRGWISPPGCGAYFSFGFRFDCGLQRLGAVSLVAGVAAAEVVARAGVSVGLKWPNDLVVDGAKLGGLLVEIRGASEGPCEVVAGVGINCRLPRATMDSCGFIAPDQAWTDLHSAVAGDRDLNCNRNRLIGRLARALDAAFGEFECSGFEPFRSRWQALDALHGRRVRVLVGDASICEGAAAGVDEHGQLRVEYDGEIRIMNAGEVSVRTH